MTGPTATVFETIALALLITAPRASALPEEPRVLAPEPPSFHQDVVPILRTKCQGCHQPARNAGRVVLTSYERLVEDRGARGDLVVPGSPGESLLVEVIVPAEGDPPRMPKNAPPLSDADVDIIRRWIGAGAEDDTPAAGKLDADPDNPPVYTTPPVITSIAFSPDGRLLAISGRHEVLLHEISVPEEGEAGAPGSKLLARLVGLAERIESVAFSPDGKLLAVAGGSPAQAGEVQIWDVAEEKLRVSRPVAFDTLRGVAWSPDGKLVSFGCPDNSVRAIEAATGEQVLYQGAHDDWVLDTVFSTDGSHLVSVSRDMAMKLIAVETQQFIDNITSITPGALRGGLMAVDRHPTKDELLAGGADGTPRIYKMYRTEARKIGDDFNLIRKLAPVPGRIFAARYSRDGSRVVIGSSLDGAGEVRVYGADDGKLFWRVATPSAVYAATFAPGGHLVAAGGFDGLLRLLEGETGKVLAEVVPVPLETPSPTAPSDPPPAAAGDVARDATTEPSVVDGGDAGELARIEVFPDKVELDGRFSYRQLVVTGVRPDGTRLDVTRIARTNADDASVVVSPERVVRAVRDGEGALTIEAGGVSATIPVHVRGVAGEPRVSYVADVMPVLARAGCNSGTCHGSAKGKGGFKLSLRGYDPAADHRALTDDLEARRFDRAVPERSLFLLKPTGSLPHGGGAVLQPGGPYYETLRSWVAAGVQADLARPRVASIEVFPKDPVLAGPGSTLQMAVLARTVDGSVRDVTREAFLESSSTEVLQVDRQGLVTAQRRGGAAILARYEGRYATSSIFVMGDRSGFAWKDTPAHNWIDEVVQAHLRRIKALTSDLSTDAEFLRRVHLDLTGLPPRREEVLVFLADARDSRTKRNEVIDRLIGSADFVEHWTNKWCDLLQVNRKFLGEPGARALRDWVRGAVASNMPYDRFARSLLNSSGSTLKEPPTAYYKVLRTPEAAMENTTQLFLGIRFSCNKCHDHPFERWTQKNYWELAAFFARIKRENAPGSPLMPERGGNQPGDARAAYEELISDGAEGELTSPQGGSVVEASFPFTHADEGSKEAPRRARLTDWVVSPSNPYFARSFVNRIWSYFIGKGLVDPVDDVRAGNPPAIPELLDRLTEEFTRSGFDVRHVMRTIVRSRVYQQAIETNEWNDDENGGFSHAIARRLPAETLYDAIHRATGSTLHLPGMRKGARAASALDGAVKVEDGFLDLFGRPPRESACECERAGGMSLGQSLNLVNGPTVAEAIADPQNGIASLLAVEEDPRRIVEDLFLSVLCRRATRNETDAFAPELDPRHRESADALEPEAAAELVRRMEAWEKAQAPPAWMVLEPGIVRSAGGATLLKEDDLSVLATGEAPEKDSYTIVCWTDLEGLTGLRLEVLPDESLPKKGAGRAENGNFVLQELKVAAAPAADPAAAKKVELQNATADFSQKDYPVGGAVDGKPETGWAIMPAAGARHVAVFEGKEDFGARGGTILTLTLKQDFGGKHAIGRFRVSVTQSPRPVRFSRLPENIAQALRVPRDQRTPEEAQAIYRLYIAGDQEMADRIRLRAAQDLTWALINSPSFLFNR